MMSLFVHLFVISAKAVLRPTWILHRLSLLSFSFCSIKPYSKGQADNLQKDLLLLPLKLDYRNVRRDVTALVGREATTVTTH